MQWKSSQNILLSIFEYHACLFLSHVTGSLPLHMKRECFFLCCHYVLYNNVFTIISNIFKELLGWKSKHTTSQIMQQQGMRTWRAINDCNPKHYGNFGPFIEGNNYPIQPLETLLTKSLNAMFYCFCSLNESRIKDWDFNAERIHCSVLEYIHNERTDVSITNVIL